MSLCDDNGYVGMMDDDLVGFVIKHTKTKLKIGKITVGAFHVDCVWVRGKTEKLPGIEIFECGGYARKTLYYFHLLFYSFKFG